MYSCYVIDNELYSISLMKGYIGRIANLNYIGSNTDSEQAIIALKSGKAPDIIFLEAKMPGLSGLEVFKLLPKDSLVIFITSHAHLAYDAFENDMVDFLLKPISFERFNTSMAKVSAILEHSRLSQEKLFLDISTKQGSLSILNKNEILYIEVTNQVMNMVTMKGNCKTKSSLKEFLGKLPALNYIRINRSCAVNKLFVKYIENNEVVMHNGDRLTISTSFKKAVVERIKES